jgi:predicted MFS family arabinose efflux permease
VVAEELDAYEDAIWFTSAYLVSLVILVALTILTPCQVAMASVAPIAGRLSYIVTPRIVMFLSTLILALGGLVTGLAPSLPLFLIGRVISGTGAAGVLSVAIILVIQLTTPEKRGLWTGILNSGFTAGVAFGAVFAGYFEPTIGWRALFWIQSPLSLLGGFGLMASIPASMRAFQTEADRAGPKQTMYQRLAAVDYIGAFLLVLTIVSLLYGLTGPSINWISIVISFSVLPVFLFQETYRHPNPIIPVVVLKSRAVLLSNIATLGFMMSRWAVLFYTPMYAMAVRGWSPTSAGSILVPTNAGFALGGLISGGIHIRSFGSWWAASVAIFALFPLTLAALAFESTKDSATWLVILSTFSNGLCAGAAINYTLHHLLFLVVPDVRFIATSLLATFRGFAGTFGSAIGGGIFVRVLQRSLRAGFQEHGVKGQKELIRRLLGSPRAVQALVGVERDVAIAAYTKAIQTLFFAAAGLSILMLFVQGGTGWTAPEGSDDTAPFLNGHEGSDDDEESL